MNLLTKPILSAAATTVALSAVTLTASAPAQALSFSVSPNPFDFGPTTTWVGQPTSVIDFPSGGTISTSPTALTSTNTLLNGTASIQSLLGTNTYGVIGDGIDTGVGLLASSVRLNFSQSQGFLGLFWAIPNANSSITFNTASGNQTFTATDLGLGFGLAQGRYINFFATTPGDIFSSVVLSQNAGVDFFAVRNVAYQAIPTPALLPGLLAVGAGLLRKRKAEAEAEAEG